MLLNKHNKNIKLMLINKAIKERMTGSNLS